MAEAALADIDVVAYLASKGIQGRKAAGDEVSYPCFFECGEPSDSRKRKLYVNTQTGLYHCKVCLVEGGTHLLQKHFGDDPKVEKLPGHDPFTRRQILRQAVEVGDRMLRANDDVIEYLFSTALTRFGPGRGLSMETIVERQLGYASPSWSLVDQLKGFHKDDLKSSGLVYRDGGYAGQDFFSDALLIPYIAGNGPAMIRGRALDPHSKAKYMNGPGMDHMLFSSDDLDGPDGPREDVVMTEGEFDCMLLKQTLAGSPEDRVRNFGVVGIAGTGAIPKGLDTYLAQAKRIYIALDPDDAGRRAAAKLKEQIGARARIVELPGGEPKVDWTEFIARGGAGWRECMDVIGHASGKRVFSMREAGTAWRNRAVSARGIRTGYQGLDDVILPGMLPGQVTVFLAKTGVGKTLMLCNLAYHMREHFVLFISLEMTREEVYDRLRKIYLFWRPNASDEQVEFELRKIFICDENRLTNQDFKTLIEEFVVETGQRPEMVFVDYLGYFARSQSGNSTYEKVTNAVMQLKEEAKGGTNQDPSKRFHIVAPAQVNRVAKEGKPIDIDDARDSGAIEETADFLFSIYKPDDALDVQTNANPSGRVVLEILKSRHGGKGKRFSLVMDYLTLAIVENDHRKAREALDHNRRENEGWTWDDLRREQLAPAQQRLQLA